jgi:tripartite-type tricarboxylate transporter receptor subunit TctC
VHAAPDGYTLLVVSLANVFNATLYDKLNFDFIHDIAPIASIDRQPFVLETHPSVPARTVPEFIAYAKANPGKINMASAGAGSAPHVLGELFKTLAGVDLLHVPYRGNPLPELLSGQVQVFFGPIQSGIEYIRTGKLRALAVTTVARSEILPDVPVLSDFVPGYEASAWLGLGAPRNTPADIVERLNRETNASLLSPEMKARFRDLGDTAFTSQPAEFGKLLTSETEKWGKVIRAANIKGNERRVTGISERDAHETSPATISPSGRRCGRAPGHAARRKSASLSVTASADHRWLPAGRRDRRHGSSGRSPAA